MPLGPGAIATGQIERTVPFEPPVPVRDGGPAGVFLERDGRLVDDDATIDDQAVVVNVADKGLIVMTACGHAGVINTIRQAQRLTGVDRIHAVMGGFHTGFPGVPAENARADDRGARRVLAADRGPDALQRPADDRARDGRVPRPVRPQRRRDDDRRRRREAADVSRAYDASFYRGHGWDDLSGPDAERTRELTEVLEARR